MLITILKIYLIIGVCLIAPITTFLFLTTEEVSLPNAILLGIINIIHLPIKIIYNTVGSVLLLILNGLSFLAGLLIPFDEEEFLDELDKEYLSIDDEELEKLIEEEKLGVLLEELSLEELSLEELSKEEDKNNE